MKVIQIGNQKIFTTKKTCGYCKSKLEYTPSDVKYDRDGSYVVCPVCGKFLAVGNSNVQTDRSKDC